MSIVECKKCRETVATTESVKDKSNFICKWCKLGISSDKDPKEKKQ